MKSLKIRQNITPNTPISARMESRADMGRGMIAGMIWKRSCINLFIIYFRQIVLWRNKQNEIIEWIYMEVYIIKYVFNKYNFRTLFSNKIISTPININGNI
jgi:hypothetical protein